MWSKFKNIIFGKKEQTPQELMTLALNEMEQALLRHQKASHNAQKREEELTKHLTNASNSMEEWKDSIAQAVKKRNEASAKRLLAKEGLLKHRLQHFQSLHAQAVQTLTMLEQQQQKLMLKIEEVKSKQVMLMAQLDGAQSQQDLQEFLQGLDGNGLWDDLDMTLDGFEEVDPMDAAIDAAISDEVNEARLLEIQQELEATALAKQKKAEAKKMERANGFFQHSPESPPINKVEDHKKKEKLQAFINSQSTPVSDQNKRALLDAFKSNHIDDECLNQQQKDLFEQFMIQQEKSTANKSEEDWGEEAFKKMEDNSIVSSKAQNKIDDFFKDI